MVRRFLFCLQSWKKADSPRPLFTLKTGSPIRHSRKQKHGTQCPVMGGRLWWGMPKIQTKLNPTKPTISLILQRWYYQGEDFIPFRWSSKGTLWNLLGSLLVMSPFISHMMSPVAGDTWRWGRTVRVRSRSHPSIPPPRGHFWHYHLTWIENRFSKSCESWFCFEVPPPQ